jgi:catechol-2,3-dioxygenase
MEFRSARHTDNLKQIEEFYTKIIGLKVLFSFENHNDYSGVFIGKKGLNWHLEFTTSNDKAEHQFDVEDLWVFYPTEKAEYDKIVEQIKVHNIEILRSKNPFWNDNGIMVQDPDGYGVIVSHLRIK